jgi:hypothetical protein
MAAGIAVMGHFDQAFEQQKHVLIQTILINQHMPFRILVDPHRGGDMVDIGIRQELETRQRPQVVFQYHPRAPNRLLMKSITP